RQAKVQAYVGSGAKVSDPPPADVRAIESLGSFVIVRLNPASTHAADEASACAAARTVAHALAGHFALPPLPVAPVHGDYLHHADLGAAAKARFLAGDTPVRGLRIKGGNLVQDHLQESSRDADWDAEVIEVDAADLMASAMYSVNGWLAPPWVRTGWFHA